MIPSFDKHGFVCVKPSNIPLYSSSHIKGLWHAVLWHRGKHSFFHPIIARSILDKKPPLFPQRIHNSRCLIFYSDQEMQRIIQPWTLQLFSMEESYRTESIMEQWSVWFISFLIIVAMYLFPHCISTACCLDLTNSIRITQKHSTQQETVLHYCQAYLKVSISPAFLMLQKTVPHYVNQIFWNKTLALSQRVLARKTQQKCTSNFTLKQKIATQHKIKQRLKYGMGKVLLFHESCSFVFRTDASKTTAWYSVLRGGLGLKQVKVDKKQISKILCPTIIICNETILGCLETVWAAKPLTCKTRSLNPLFM